MGHAEEVSKNKMICPGCNKVIEKDQKQFLQASDRPYVNIIWHRDCWRKATEEQKDLAINNFLLERMSNKNV